MTIEVRFMITEASQRARLLEGLSTERMQSVEIGRESDLWKDAVAVCSFTEKGEPFLDVGHSDGAPVETFDTGRYIEVATEFDHHASADSLVQFELDRLLGVKRAVAASKKADLSAKRNRDKADARNRRIANEERTVRAQGLILEIASFNYPIRKITTRLNEGTPKSFMAELSALRDCLASERRMTDIGRWVDLHGSGRLKACKTGGVDLRKMFAVEMVRKDFPQWDLIQGKVEFREARNPPNGAIDILQEAVVDISMASMVHFTKLNTGVRESSSINDPSASLFMWTGFVIIAEPFGIPVVYRECWATGGSLVSSPGRTSSKVPLSP